MHYFYQNRSKEKKKKQNKFFFWANIFFLHSSILCGTKMSTYHEFIQTNSFIFTHRRAKNESTIAQLVEQTRCRLLIRFLLRYSASSAMHFIVLSPFLLFMLFFFFFFSLFTHLTLSELIFFIYVFSFSSFASSILIFIVFIS